MVEVEDGFLADVEGLPVEQGLLGGLADADVDEIVGVDGLCGSISTCPSGGIGGRVKAARAESVGDGGEAGCEVVGPGFRGGAGGVLHGAQGVERVGGAGERVLGVGSSLCGIGGCGTADGSAAGACGSG